MPELPVDLVLDVGNTRTKWALFRGGQALAHGWTANGDTHALQAAVAAHPIADIVVGSTAAPDPPFLQELSARAPVTVITGASPSPLRNAYGTPHSLGADRLANAVAAARRFPGRAVLAISMGTCITYDLVEADGSYRGGAISPGLRMRGRAMATFTARLPDVVPDDAVDAVGTSTEGSLAAGIHFGILGELEGFIRRYGKDRADLAVVLTGGDALPFVRGLESGIFALPLLTLEGYHALLLHHRTLGDASGAAPSTGGHGPGAAG